MRAGFHRSLRALPLAGLLALSLDAGSAVAAGSSAGVADREADPVVVTGERLDDLRGTAPGRIVAFRFARERWRQVPVQVDERAVVAYHDVRRLSGSRTFSAEAYTDPGTFAGADPDPSFDADDEIAAMARDAGARADVSAKAPRGVGPGSRVELRIADPLRNRKPRPSYLYLFRSRGKLDPAAGKRYVDYQFRLDSGDYQTTYDFNGIADNGNGPPGNTETSTVSTPFYEQRLLSRWIQDELHIRAPGGSGVDILDGDKVQVANGCGRSELTFSRGGGGFIANTSGAIRAIRSYVGANSGIYTQRDHVYYERSEVATTTLRVHPGITALSQYYDYSPDAIGMTYRNSLNPGGVTIDGVPDSVETGVLNWEQVSGPEGSMSIVHRATSTVPGFTTGSLYLDDSTDPPIRQCGRFDTDDLALGASGVTSTSSGANTDPTLGEAFSLVGTRTTFYGSPEEGAEIAALHGRQVDAPLRVRVK